ncbi:MAG: dihydrolipoyl dehydrogenase [FCB group bacterium]|nr:dihydrolipoyl dehydrogenase [FCB group bacterium]
MKKINTEVAVIGAGPGGYAAAFRAADLGKSVTLIDKNADLGGVCLNRGCIPSKALLHLARVLREAEDAGKMGISFQAPEIDLEKVKSWKNRVVTRLNKGVAHLAKLRNVTVVRGTARFGSAAELTVETAEGELKLGFDHCIIATGSRPAWLPNLPKPDDRLMDSTGALELASIPQRLLVIGGGYIGLELGSAYQAFGAEVSVVEFMPTLLPGADADLVKPLQVQLKKSFSRILLSTKVTAVVPKSNCLTVTLSDGGESINEDFDKILVSVGRRPNTDRLGLEKIGVGISDRGFIITDEKRQTNIPGIYAIGDITGDPMLAHKATAEGKVAAEVIAGLPAAFDPAAIPAVIFTDPEIAWAGLTETRCQEMNIPYQKAEFPWSASGRALTLGRSEGKTKVLGSPETGRILGIGIVGPGAGDLIAEGVLAMEMGADMEDVGLTIHPHPTLSETIGNAAEVFTGSVTDLPAQ